MNARPNSAILNQIQAEQAAQVGLFDRGKILSVEDNEDHQCLLEAALDRDDRTWSVKHVSNLAEMEHAAKEIRPQAVLLDLGLQESQGLKTLDQALTLLRETVPVLVLTADRDQSIGVSAVRHGAADFIDKFALHRADVGLRIAFAVERFSARRAIERSNRVLKTFVASVGHDLRAPPRQIDFLAETIEDALDGAEPEITRALKGIRDRARHLQGALSATLDYAYNATLKPSCKWTDLGTLLKRVLADCDADEAARVSFSSSCEVYVDPHLAYLMLGNLVGNSLKYWRDIPSKVYVAGAESEQHTEIVVRDSGIGMSEETLRRANLPAIRGVSGAEFEGSGFGLAIVTLLIEAHGGSMDIMSSEGGGTQVKLILPKPSRP